MPSTAVAQSLPAERYLTNHDFLETVDELRAAAFNALPSKYRSQMGQFGTPLPVTLLMASMFRFESPSVRLLDAGAGIGSLSAAFVNAACLSGKVKSIQVTAYEVEPALADKLENTMAQCLSHCAQYGITFSYEIVRADFIEHVVSASTDLFAARLTKRFNYAIQNPPYKKIKSDSNHRFLLRSLNIETTNLYAAFMSLTVRLLEPNGQLVAITPRSFCNGPYFNSFRQDFLNRMHLRRLHVFDSRSKAFGTDGVLQENIISYSTLNSGPKNKVFITSSSGEPGGDELQRWVEYKQVVPANSQNPFIHLITDGTSELVAKQMSHFSSSLDDTGMSVSTGRVVDFRAKQILRDYPQDGDSPLIYPMHLKNGTTTWPVENAKKPNALLASDEATKLVVPPGVYVLVKRFSSKEQRRRIEAAIYDSCEVCPNTSVGFENHLNYFHEDNEGLHPELALGLCVYLNSSLVDLYFRLFSGHTQVNATDLRILPFPTREQLLRLGQSARGIKWSQVEIDELIGKELIDMAKQGKINPVSQKKKVEEAEDILKQLGFPSAQSNERSALVLLALSNLKSNSDWQDARQVMLGITEMMTYFDENYGKKYAPNSRETVRRQTVHQFLEAGLIEQNPDDPGRPVNSGKNVYQLIPEAIRLLRKYGTDKWEAARKRYLSKRKALKKIYAQKREMERIPVKINSGEEILLSPGGQNVLVKEIINEFVPRFSPGGQLLYVGDTEDKWAYFDEKRFKKLSLDFDSHGKFPDVIVHMKDKNWLLLVEAVTSHGPVNPKRHKELKDLFGKAKAGLVYVTTFLTRKDLNKYLGDIAWETEVWVADSPGHMIHFNGKRFLGPYQD